MVQGRPLFNVVRLLGVLILCSGLYFVAFQSLNKEGDALIVPPAGKEDLIRVTSPVTGSVVTSPLTVVGEARGNWFFEATFPVYVTDWDGLIIGEGFATAEGEWMTTSFVPFTAVITFNTAEIRGHYSNRGTLILKKHNASGLPEHDDALEVPILLK